MDFDLDRRHARLGVGELSDFALGPRDATGGPAGLWRAQLGTHWHRQLQTRAAAEFAAAEFEVVIEGEVFHRGWTLAFNGRIDQLVRAGGSDVLREIKTVTRALPAPEAELRAEYPAYFAQAAAYLVLLRGAATSAAAPPALGGELVFVEADTGLSQVVPLVPGDEAFFRGQLERVVEFLELRVAARRRLAALSFSSPFDRLRPGQEAAGPDLAAAIAPAAAKVMLEAPTGFGKTGVLLECALGQLRSGRFERVIYLTGKSTGQLQVGRTLAAMTPAGGVAIWVVRPKSEHCVNAVFHCVRESCGYLDGMEERWAGSGLARFYLRADGPRDLTTLREAGREARICPYEITRAALAGNDVWIGDYNYVFAPSASGLFAGQPGFDPARTLLLVDEAHNLPSRVADAYSHTATAESAQGVLLALQQVRAPALLIAAWQEWTRVLEGLEPVPALEAEAEAAARRLVAELADLIATTPVDYAALGPRPSELLWQAAALGAQFDAAELPRLCWCPRRGTLALTCLDAAAAIGARLREYGGVVLASATPPPPDTLAEVLGLDREEIAPEKTLGPERLGELTKRETRRLSARVTSAASLLRASEERAAALSWVRAATPWRDGAYDVAFDLRVDTTFQRRAGHYETTGRTVAALARSGLVAVFFSSYAYAEAIAGVLEAEGAGPRVALQPRQADLSAQAAWLEEALTEAGALFLVLGSSFAESVDLLGGRVERAMVVGPALPEVNPVQQARVAALAGLGREAAFRRVYQIPGMQKVNQALGRLVRAPGQHARVLLHCRRFGETEYSRLLAPDYQVGPRLRTDEDFARWLER
jgi:DNA excision repair protein ERCC-2